MDFIGEIDSLIDKSAVTPGGKTCTVSFIMDQLPDEQAHKLNDLLESNVRASAIADLLQRYGFTISPETVQRHRRRKLVAGCRCP